MTLAIDTQSMIGQMAKQGRAAMIDAYNFTTEMTKIQIAANALASFSFPIPLRLVYLSDLSALLGTAATGNLGFTAGTAGTNTPLLTSGEVKNTTDSRKGRLAARVEAVPDSSGITCIISAKTSRAASSGKYSRLALNVYRSDKAGGCIAYSSGVNDWNITAAQALTTSYALYSFTIPATAGTGGGVPPTKGDVLDCVVSLETNDADNGTSLILTIGAIYFPYNFATA